MSNARNRAAPEPTSSGRGNTDPDILTRNLAQLDSTPPDMALRVDPLVDRPEDCGEMLRRVLTEAAPSSPLRSLRIDSTSAKLQETELSDQEQQLKQLLARETESNGFWSVCTLTPLAVMRSHINLHLTALTLTGMPFVTVNALAALGDLTKLRALRIENSPGLPTDAVRELQLLTHVQLLSFNGCRAIDDQCVGYAMAMVDLHALHLDDTACSDVAVLIATVLPKLCRLHMRRTAVSDHGIRVLSKRASLTDLAMGGCHELSDEGATQLASQQRMRRLELAECPHVSVDTIAHLRRTLPAGCCINAPSPPLPGPLRTAALQPEPGADPGVGRVHLPSTPGGLDALPAAQVSPGTAPMQSGMAVGAGSGVSGTAWNSSSASATGNAWQHAGGMGSSAGALTSFSGDGWHPGADPRLSTGHHGGGPKRTMGAVGSGGNDDASLDAGAGFGRRIPAASLRSGAIGGGAIGGGAIAGGTGGVGASCGGIPCGGSACSCGRDGGTTMGCFGAMIGGGATGCNRPMPFSAPFGNSAQQVPRLAAAGAQQQQQSFHHQQQYPHHQQYQQF